MKITGQCFFSLVTRKVASHGASYINISRIFRVCARIRRSLLDVASFERITRRETFHIDRHNRHELPTNNPIQLLIHYAKMEARYFATTDTFPQWKQKLDMYVATSGQVPIKMESLIFYKFRSALHKNGRLILYRVSDPPYKYRSSIFDAF